MSDSLASIAATSGTSSPAATAAEAPAQPAPASTGRESAGPTSLRGAIPALIGLCLTMLVEMVDNSILNVALPTVGRDLHASATDLQWIVGAYSLTFGGLLLVGGTLGDKLGRKRTLLVGLALFGIVNLGVLLVQNPAQLIAVRALAGAVAAMIAPLTMSLVFRIFPTEALRGKAIGLIVTVSMIGFAIGPTLSGIAVEHWPWEALLVLNAPMALIAWIGVRFGVPADDPDLRRQEKTDWPGAVLSVLALGTLLYTFTSGVDRGWGSPWTIGVLAVGVASLLGFVWRERTTDAPMLDMKLLALPAVRGSALLQTATMVAMVGVMFAATQLYQFAWGFSPMMAGLAMLPFVVGMMLASPVVDSVVGRIGHRRASIVGIVAVLAGLGLWWFALTAGYWLSALGMLVITFGIRIIMTTGAVALISALPETHTTLGSSLNDTSQELGNSVGVAVVGTVLATVAGTALGSGQWDAAQVDSFVHALHIAFGILAGIVVVTAAIGIRSLTDSTSTDEH